MPKSVDQDQIPPYHGFTNSAGQPLFDADYQALHAEARERAQRGRVRTQCHDATVPGPRRFATVAELRSETAAWSTATNETQRGVDWPFRTADARTKLKSLYPELLA